MTLTTDNITRSVYDVGTSTDFRYDSSTFFSFSTATAFASGLLKRFAALRKCAAWAFFTMNKVLMRDP